MVHYSWVRGATFREIFNLGSNVDLVGATVTCEIWRGDFSAAPTTTVIYPASFGDVEVSVTAENVATWPVGKSMVGRIKIVHANGEVTFSDEFTIESDKEGK